MREPRPHQELVMMHRRSLAIAFAVIAAIANGQSRASAPAGCVAYDSDTVSLAGRVIRRVYAGRPGYESVARGDEPDTVLVLVLDGPLYPVTTSFSRLTIASVKFNCTSPAKRFLSTLGQLGSRMTLRGTIEGAVWGWHHLPVVFHTRLPPPPQRGAV